MTTWGEARKQAFQDALARHKGVDCVTVEAPPGQAQLALLNIRQLLGKQGRPTAVFAATDLLAKVVYRVADELGLKIPHDLSVIGFADDDFSAELMPALTTVRQPAYDIGCRAAEIVISNSAARGALPIHDELGVSLIVRASTASACIK